MAEASQLTGPASGRQPSRLRVVIVLGVITATVGGLLGAGLYWRWSSSSHGDYDKARTELSRQVSLARADGYSDQDLASARQVLDETRPAPGLAEQLQFRQITQRLDAARAELPELKTRALSRYSASADQAIASLRAILDRATAAGAQASDLRGVSDQLNELTAKRAAAGTPKDLSQVNQDAASVATKVQELAAALELERGKIEASAADLRVRHPGDPEGIRKEASGALAQGRNDGTVAALLKLAEAARPTSEIERYAAKLSAADVNGASTAAAGVVYNAGVLHALLLQGMPQKAILISITGQRLIAYQKGQQVRDTLVTSGRPPDLNTDIGAMKVLRKSSPWKMQSPWPKGSPFYYPPTVVQQVVWFTNTGEGLHDASWQPYGWGPGSQNGPFASHGCVHVPVGSENFLYDWADVGTPVVVYPGDGGTVESQLKQVSVDAAGQPLTGPKGA